MKALTVKQPWAWAILHAGKTVENRSRRTHYRGELLIHAGAAFDVFGVNRFATLAFGLDHHDAIDHSVFEFGAIVGRVKLVDCVEDSDSRWAVPGMFHWVLDDPEPFDTPIPCRGALGLWTPPLELALPVRA